MVSDPQDLEREFPNLSTTGYLIASPEDVTYNCIAWAAHDMQRWWWPSQFYYWPANVPREETVSAFIQAYVSLGFELCDSDQLEPRYEKVAIYVDPAGKPTHSARQLNNGRWTSKLGNLEDIEHDLNGLTGSSYGFVVQILRRPTSGFCRQNWLSTLSLLNQKWNDLSKRIRHFLWPAQARRNGRGERSS